MAANPFEKRATEYLRDDEAFLGVVSPEPLMTFFRKPGKDGSLFDRLVLVVGTPGSGKTTLARLFQYSTMQTLLRHSASGTYRPLLDALMLCGGIDNREAVVLGCRIPLESEYREFWQLPYEEELRSNLMIGLLQARAVLSWLRQLANARVPMDKVRVVAKDGADAPLAAIGGTRAEDVRSRARVVERAIYDVSAAIRPPQFEDIDREGVDAYRPFDVIDYFELETEHGVVRLRPLVMLDDAHSLHPTQFEWLQKWLMRRELRVARWMLTRLDALSPTEVLLEVNAADPTAPGSKRSREITVVRMQSSADRSADRRQFRKMAKDMAQRYLGSMDVFRRRGLEDLGDLLSMEVAPLAQGKLQQLNQHVDSIQIQCGVSDERRDGFQKLIDAHLRKAKLPDAADDLRLAMLAILMERYKKRTPQLDLFGDDFDVQELEPNRPIGVDASVVAGARVHLLHRVERPLYFGVDSVCDSGTENAEQFLHLAGRLVSQMETQLIRGKNATLSAQVQHRLLRERASQSITEWDFPQHHAVRRLTRGMAAECLKKSLEGNASLGGGANAFGIPQSEFDELPTKDPDLARVLKYAVAYNAIVIVPSHGTKRRDWCLIELGGATILEHGLTLARGGFLERRAADLSNLLRVS